MSDRSSSLYRQAKEAEELEVFPLLGFTSRFFPSPVHVSVHSQHLCSAQRFSHDPNVAEAIISASYFTLRLYTYLWID
jgi:hypothetical protein